MTADDPYRRTNLNIQRKLVLACLLALIMAPAAYPQRKEMLQLQADMIRLSQQMTQLQSTVDMNNAALKGLVEKMADQVNTLGGSVQKITQAMDGVKSQTDKTSSELRVILNNMNSSVGELQEALAAVRTQINSVSQQVTAKNTTAEKLAGPDDIMRTAVGDYLAGNYELALGGFQEFMEKYPNDPRASDAQLYKGETFFNQKKFDQAVVEYDVFLQNYPENDKTRTALYKKGLALAEQNQKQPALVALDKVIKDFPNTSEAQNAQAKARELRGPVRR
jgi:tol-pal system protein YbgF